MQNAVEGRRGGRGEIKHKEVGETAGVRGKAVEGQVALSRVHCSYFAPLICLVLVPSLYYFSTFTVVCRDGLIVLPCRGEMQIARCSAPLSFLTSLLIFSLRSAPSLMNQDN